MSEQDLVVNALQSAMRGLSAKPDLTDWRIGRIAELEGAVRSYVEHIYETGRDSEMGNVQRRLFMELCEAIGFDGFPDEPDPDAAYDRRGE